jgi:crotonobetainyl-CoA:carnitine CoA-transferase CaiB-like acyl-CoA transferase
MMPHDPASLPTPTDAAFDDVTIIEFGGYAAGPAIGKYLANFGARVIHVESVGRPDGFRLQYPPYKDDRVGLNRSGCFAIFNDSKLGVTLDLKRPPAVAFVRRLIARADAVIENMRPGVMAKIGLSQPLLRADNPRLVVLSTSNLGQTGPRAAHPGFGSQLSSLSGFTELIGLPEGPPQCLYGPYIDMIAVAFGGAALLAALDRQRRTGEGAFIDLSQYEAGLQFIAPALVDYALNGVIARRDGNRDPVAVPHGCYPSREQGWVTISCWDDEEWVRLGDAIGGPAWTVDPRFRTAVGRRAGETELNDHLAAWTRQLEAREVMARLQDARVHAAVVNTMEDLHADPQIAARAVWQSHDHPEIGPMRYRMGSYQLSDTPGLVRHGAPCLGEHNIAVFREWFGLAAEEYEDLAAQGVFS